MLERMLRIFFIVIGVLIGPGAVLLFSFIYNLITEQSFSAMLPDWALFILYAVAAAISGIIFLFLSKRIASHISQNVQGVAKKFSKVSPVNVTAGIIGLILGLIIAGLLNTLIGNIPVVWVSIPLSVFVYIIFGWLGWTLGYKRKLDFSTVFRRKSDHSEKGETAFKASPKILDTSAIIDGRIYDIYKTGIFEGELIIPSFVLTELQHIADSADSMKRTKGRRGLDILNTIREEFSENVKITNIDFEDIPEVDAKLIRLAKELGGKVVTTDFNLNKVATVYQVEVFNINDLANAVKPVMLPGEEMKVIIVKDGKEQNQGVAYLDDGTMIVVEGAKGKAGAELDVVVTSVLQTSAGRMIFAKIK